MKGFAKFLLVIGILSVCLSLVLALSKNALAYTYSEFKDDLLANERLQDLTDEDINARYEEYLQSDSEFSRMVTLFFLICGLGCVIAAFGIVYFNRLFDTERIKNKYLYETKQ